MTLETFFEKFELFADTPNAVAKMRELMLQLAVRGKLTEQFASESVQTQIERTKSFRSGNGEDESFDSVDNPFVVPENWEWVRIGNAMTMVNGRAFKPEEWSTEGVPIIRIQNLNNDGAAFNHCRVDLDPKFHVHNGDFLISWSGTPGTSFGAFIWNRGFAFLNQHIFRCELAEGVFQKEFLRLAVNARLDEMISHAQGAVGLRHITKGKLESIRLPLPPLAEQKRIVAKVDELMALCDRLEAQQKERETQQATLARAAVARFADAPIPANIELLFHKSYSVPPADLRKTILTLAVQGKLVPQDPEDEPVEEILLQIFDEQRKLKRTTANSFRVREPSEILDYDIPQSWRWQVLEDLVVFGPTNGFSPKAVEYETPVRSLTLSATTSGRFKPEHSKFIPNDIPANSDLWLRDGDILVQRGNTLEYVGVSAVYHGDNHRFVYPDLMMKLRVSSKIDVDYMHLAMSSEPCRDFLRARASGTSGSMPKINQTTLKNLPLPLPPFAEQRRIVAKVNQLMALVDKLEAQLAASRAAATTLMDALVAELTAGSLDGV